MIMYLARKSSHMAECRLSPRASLTNTGLVLVLRGIVLLFVLIFRGVVLLIFFVISGFFFFLVVIFSRGNDERGPASPRQRRAL